MNLVANKLLFCRNTKMKRFSKCVNNNRMNIKKEEKVFGLAAILMDRDNIA